MKCSVILREAQDTMGDWTKKNPKPSIDGFDPEGENYFNCQLIKDEEATYALSKSFSVQSTWINHQ